MIAKFKERAYRWSLMAAVLIGVVSMVALTNASTVGSKELSAAQAELMGRVEDFFLHNYRDITWVKSLEWSDFKVLPDGNRTIAYLYKARIWDRETVIIKDIFAFDGNGKFISVKKAEGFPKKEAPKVVDTSSQKGMQALVDDFFQNNFRDISSRSTIEWGNVVKEKNGNSSIRYKYDATIWGKDKMIMNQIFTFDPKGTFVTVTNVEGFPKKK